ncbi:MAG: F0F1 ATP synthase subunit A [Clostridia bacterium]|nr:F0F1 ATP synthase subunit A [Clostridia bacterium]
MNIQGPEIYYTLPGGIHITETVVNMWILMAVITAVCAYLGHNLKDKPETRRQIVAEYIVSKLYTLVGETMGAKNLVFAPYIGTLITFSALGSLSSLAGFRPITADLNVPLAWALVTFIMVQTFKIKGRGIGKYLKGFFEPTPVIAPLNINSEIANPISMAFRQFGNIASGVVITSLIYMALAGLSNMVLNAFPIPLFQLGIPAFLSIYFDLFTGLLQAYIFCMLTMVFVAEATN